MQMRLPFDSPGPPVSGPARSPDATLEWVCRSALQAWFPSLSRVGISASFYPYVGLTHTIRRRDGAWVLRISDHCRHAPRSVLESIAALLACKVLRRKPRKAWLQTYDAYRRSPEVEAQVRERRLRRGRKVICAAGRHHALQTLVEDLNERFFNHQIEIARIGWSAKRSWTRLGHFDPVHRTITITPVLDSPEVPPLVLAFLVYHEMLHAVFDEERSGRRKRHHTRAFKAAERAYPDYAAARRFLEVFCRTRGKRSPKRLK